MIVPFESVKFIEGDFVVVVGDSLGNDGNTNRKMIIAEVMGVGIEELFLRCQKTQVTFKRPIGNCRKIPKIKPKQQMHTTRLPTLGDLVLSYTGSRYSKQKRVVGILIEIIDDPPDDLDARILCGDETHVVAFKSLIVVESK
jgi:hypothetical protein